MLNQKNDTGPFAGAWARGANVSAGLASGPVVLFDGAARTSLVLAPASEFMAVSAARSADGAVGPFKSGVEFLVRRTGAVVVPLY